MNLRKIFNVSNNSIGELDGLRGIAVLMVFFHHILSSMQISIGNINVSLFFHWGHLGVNIFYILSGFLLAMPFLKGYYTNDKVNLKVYFGKRALRILPAYYFYLTLYVLLLNPSLISRAGVGTLLANILFLQNFGQIEIINPVTWTLAIEVQFYILLPFIYRFFVGKNILKPIVGMFSFVLVYRVIIYFILRPDMTGMNLLFYRTSEYNILGCIDNFTIGMVIANIYVRKKLLNKENEFNNIVGISHFISKISPLVIMALIYNYYMWKNTESIIHSIYFSFFFDLSFYLIIAALLITILFNDSKINKILKNIGLRTIGISGYSIYLWHMLLQGILAQTHFINSTENEAIRYIKWTIMSIVIIIPFSMLMYLLVEKYFIDISNKIYKRKI